MDLLDAVIAVFTVIIGGGGLVSFLMMRHNKRKDIRAQDLAEATAAEEWWQERMAAQAELLIKPLRDEVKSLRDELDEVKREMEQTRTRYWRAIRTIRDLYGWIKTNLPDGSPPAPHPDIADDI